MRVSRGGAWKAVSLTSTSTRVPRICIIREVWEILVYTTPAGGGSNPAGVLELGLWETVAQTQEEDYGLEPSSLLARGEGSQAASKIKIILFWETNNTLSVLPSE